MNLAENGHVTQDEFRRIRRWILVMAAAAIIGFLLTAVGVLVVRTQGEGDARRIGCANSQGLVDQYEFLRVLAVQNQTGILTQKQIRERAQFYTEAEILARQRAGNTCRNLADMRAQARMDISHVLGTTP